jgi:hypothetical protein
VFELHQVTSKTNIELFCVTIMYNMSIRVYTCTAHCLSFATLSSVAFLKGQCGQKTK